MHVKYALDSCRVGPWIQSAIDAKAGTYVTDLVSEGLFEAIDTLSARPPARSQ